MNTENFQECFDIHGLYRNYVLHLHTRLRLQIKNFFKKHFKTIFCFK